MRGLISVANASSAKSGLLLTACIGLLCLNDPALGKPATGDVQARNHSEATRAAQLQHARNVRNAARKRSQATTPRQPVATTALAARRVDPATLKRPTFGWPTLVTEARKYMGTNPTSRSRLWCATFMNMVLARTGYAGTGSDAAKSFASYGKRINEPRVGAIAVLTRGKKGGHVGIVTGIDASGNPIIISGNHGRRVGEATYSRTRVIAYVMPVDRVGTTQVASAAHALPQRADAEQEGGAMSSPIAELLAAINAERASEQRAQAQAQPAREAARPAERAPVQRVAERPTPEARPYRVVQQVATTEPEPQRQRVGTAYRVAVAAAAVPLPRERVAVATPLPRSRPAVN
jgi:uncharacterized protein (TIGR02594 family)